MLPVLWLPSAHDDLRQIITYILTSPRKTLRQRVG